MPCHAWKCVPTDEFSVRVTKISSRIGVSWTHSLLFCFWPILTQWIMAILSKGCKPDNFESHKSLKLSFRNVRGLYLSLNQTLLTFLLYVRQTWMTWFNQVKSIDSSNFSVRGYLPLIQKNYITYMHGPAVYVKERLLFARDLSLGNCGFWFIFSTSFTSLSVVLLFPLTITFFIFLLSFWCYFI